jgi:hypothetical protein
MEDGRAQRRMSTSTPTRRSRSADFHNYSESVSAVDSHANPWITSQQMPLISISCLRFLAELFVEAKG